MVVVVVVALVVGLLAVAGAHEEKEAHPDFPALSFVEDLNRSKVILNGVNQMDTFGLSLESAGDFNGDGIDDVVIGASFDQSLHSAAGSTWVVFGRSDWSTTPVDAATLANGAVVFQGQVPSGFNGYSVAGIGDFNNDGIDDIVTGSWGQNSSAGAAFVVFGARGTWEGQTVDLSTLSGSNGFRFSGASSSDEAGKRVGAIGDVNGDGVPDIAIGAPGAGAGAGETYVVFGTNRTFLADMSVADLDGTVGFVLRGAPSDGLGSGMNSVGDVNNDGFVDFAVGARKANDDSGRTYVIYGGRSGWPALLDLSDFNQTFGFVIVGVGQSGFSVNGNVDVNNDGVGDVLIGEPFASRTAVVFGGPELPFSVNTTTLDGSNGFVVTGRNPTDLSGFTVCGVPDFNGDGVADIAISGSASDNRGELAVVYGSGQSWPAVVALSQLTREQGFIVRGWEFGEFGNDMHGFGDFNGDGASDILVGAPNVDSAVGRVLMLFGVPPSPSPSPSPSPLSVCHRLGLTDFDSIELTAKTRPIFGVSSDSVSFLGGGEVRQDIESEGVFSVVSSPFLAHTSSHQVNVDVQVGGSRMTQQITSNSLVFPFGGSSRAETVESALLRTPEDVYQDNVVVGVVYQLRDGQGRSQVDTSDLVCVVRLTNEQTGESGSGECANGPSVSSGVGVCDSPDGVVSSLSSWFSDSFVSVRVDLELIYDGGSVVVGGSAVEVGRIRLIGSPVRTTPSDFTVTASLPLGPRFPEESFSSSVVAFNSPFPFLDFRVSLVYDSTVLEVVSVTTHEDSASVDIDTATIGVVEVSSLVPTSEESEIFSVEFRVVGGVRQGVLYSNVLSGSADVLTAGGQAVVTGGVAQIVDGQIGFHTEGVLPVGVVEERGLFGFTQHTNELVNIAALGGGVTNTTVTVVSFDNTHSHQQFDVTGTSVCESSNLDKLGVSGCVAFTGLANTGGSSHQFLSVRVSRNGLVANVPIRVWYPSHVTVSVTDSVLNPISGTSGCVSGAVFQETQAVVTATFSGQGLDTSGEMDVTGHVMLQTVSQTSNVVRVMRDNGDRVVVLPVSAGTEQLTVVGLDPAVTITTATVDVGGSDVIPTLVEVSVVTDVLAFGIPGQAANDFTTTVRFEQNLNSFNANGTVLVYVDFDDGTSWELSTDNTMIQVGSLDDEVIQAEWDGAQWMARVPSDATSGCGNLIQATFSACEETVSLVGFGPVSVALPEMDQVLFSIVGSGNQIARPSDLAHTNQISVPTFVRFAVMVQLANGLLRDFTVDPRTSFNVTSGGEFVEVVEVNQHVRAQAIDGTVGGGGLVVVAVSVATPMGGELTGSVELELIVGLSQTPTTSISESVSVSFSTTGSRTVSGSQTATRSISRSSTASGSTTATITGSATATATSSVTTGASPSATKSVSLSSSATGTTTSSTTMTGSSTSSRTSSQTATTTASASSTRSSSATVSATGSPTNTPSPSPISCDLCFATPCGNECPGFLSGCDDCHVAVEPCLQNCISTVCGLGRHLCDSTLFQFSQDQFFLQCLPPIAVGDGVRDCQDGSDEGAELCGTDQTLSLDSEACDDNNISPGDGCDSLCRVEDGFYCFSLSQFTTSTPSRPTTCIQVASGETIAPGLAVVEVLDSVTNQLVSRALQTALAEALGVQQSWVVVDGLGEYINNTNSKMDTTDVAFIFHVNLPSVGDGVNGFSGLPDQAYLDNWAAITAETLPPLTVTSEVSAPVISLQKHELRQALDLLPPSVITITVNSNNPVSRQVAGPGHTVTITAFNSSEALGSFDVPCFSVASAARETTPSTPETNLFVQSYSVSPQDDSGFVTFTAAFADHSGNVATCQQDQFGCVFGRVVVDTTPPTVRLVQSDQSPNSNDNEDAVDLWVTMDLEFDEDIYSLDESLIEAHCLPLNSPPCAIIDNLSLNPTTSNTSREFSVRFGLSFIGKTGKRGEVKLLLQNNSMEDLAGNRNPVPHVIRIPLTQIVSLSEAWFWSLTAIAMLIAVLVAVVGVLLVVNRNSAVLKRSTQAFNYLILPCLVAFLAAVPLSGLPSLDVSEKVQHSACVAFPHLIVHPLVLLIVLLVARNYRLHRIFNNPALRRVKITNRDLLLAVVPFVVVHSAAAVVLFALFPPETVLAKGSGHLYRSCRFSNVVVAAFELGVLVLLCLVGVWVMSKIWGKRLAKNVQNETTHIALCFYSVAIVIAVAVPIQFVSLSPDTRFLTLAFPLLVLALAPALWILIPKLIFEDDGGIAASAPELSRNNTVNTTNSNLVWGTKIAPEENPKLQAIEESAL